MVNRIAPRKGLRSLPARFLSSSLVRWVLASGLVLASVKCVRLVVGRGLESSFPSIGDRAEDLVLAPLTVLAAWGVYSLYVRSVEKRRANELGTARIGTELGLGLILGAGVVSASIGILWLVGAFHIVRANDLGWISFTFPVVAGLTAGFIEELLVRVILFRLVEESVGTWFALLVSAALFGVAHLGNPGASAATFLGLALGPGIFFCAGYIVTRRLWLPLAIHASWNFSQRFFGIGDNDGLVQSQLSGPALLVGGEDGRVEESVVLMTLGFIAGCLILALARRKGRIVSLSEARSRKTPAPLYFGAA